MVSPNATPTPITPPYVPIIDPRTGQMHQAWYMFFLSLFNVAQTAIADDVSPDTSSQVASVAAELIAAQQAAQTQAASVLEQTQPALDNIAQQLRTLPVAASVDQVAQMSADIQALALAPAVTPQVPQRRYGSFYDTTTQSAAAINTAYAITFNTTDLSMGVTIGSPTSRIYVDRAGVYNIQFSAQLDNTSGGNHTANIWLSVNGTNVANTASRLVLKGTDGDLVAAWNYLYNFKDGDYFELMWSVTDTAVQLVAAAAAAPVPAIASVILTVTDSISNG